MPIYLAHGFRWPRDGRAGIRVYAIFFNLEQVSVEYIQNAHSRQALLECFRTEHPDVMAELEKPGRAIDFLEQYDPLDESPNATTQPWAFVCDRIVMIAGGENAEYYAGQLLHRGGMRPTATDAKKKERKKTLPMTIAAPFNSPANISALSVNVEEVMADGPGASPEAWQALADLRDQIAEGEKIGWWVVYNGDPDRAYDETDEEEDDGEDTVTPAATSPARGTLPSATTPTPRSPIGGRMPPPVPAFAPSSASRAPTQRSSTQSTLTSSSATGTTTTGGVSTPTSKERATGAGTGAGTPGSNTSASKEKSRTTSRGSQGLKKFFGGKKS